MRCRNPGPRTTSEIALLVALLGHTGCPHRHPAPGTASARPVDLVLPALDGGEFDLAAYRGRLVVVHFFTTSSLAAELDLAELRRTQGALPAGRVVLLGIGLDSAGYRLVAPWRDAQAIEHHIALPTPALLAGDTAFGDVMKEVPSTFILDRAGRIVWSRWGQLAPSELARAVEKLEAGPKAP